MTLRNEIEISKWATTLPSHISKKPVFCNLSKQPKSLAETKNTHNGCSNGQKNCGSIAIAAIACFKKYLLLPATEKRKMAFLKSRRRNEVGRKLYLKRLITNVFFPCFLFIQSFIILRIFPCFLLIQSLFIILHTFTLMLERDRRIIPNTS